MTMKTEITMLVGCLVAIHIGQFQVLAISNGDRVEANGTVNVRQTPAGTLLGQQTSGSLGVVIGGPTLATLNGTQYTWWDINFDTGADGWVADIGLTAVAPGAPTQNSPGNTSSPGPTISTLTPTMSWNAATGANGYGVYVEDVATSTLVYNNDSVGNVTSVTLPSNTLVAGHSYVWNMRSSDSAGYTYCTTVLYFQTQPATTYSITPNPASVNENAGHLTFTITRSSSVAAATVYASTVQDQGYSNNGYYVGILNQTVNFSVGQSTAQVSVTINDLGLTSGSETFRFIVQQNSIDPVSTYLATDNFSIYNTDVVTPPGTILAGFDTYAYPTDPVMEWLRQNSNLSWVGYYLYPAPSRNVASGGGNSWMGHFPTLSTQGWTVAPIYIGEQDPAHESQDPANSSNPSAAKGEEDGNSSEINSIGLANSAVPLLKQEGFPVGTTVYLDIETSGAQSQPELDYISAWCSAVSAAEYIPGVYCLASAFSSIAAVEPSVPFWIANPTDPSPGGTPFPTMDPSGSGVPNAIAWQYETAPSYTIAIPTSILPSGSLQVDLDVVKASQRPQSSFGAVSVSAGKLQTTLSGLYVGETVVIYSSTDLENWTPIKTNTASDSTLSFTNSINPAIIGEYFRAVVQ